MGPLKWLNDRHFLQRLGLKGVAGVLLCVAVFFPRIDRLPTTVRRHLDPNALIDPQAPALSGLLEEFEQIRQSPPRSPELLKELQAFVYQKIPYAWDWDLWGNVDYFPTVEETLARGREDCDGRAVLAASVLQRYGYDARLATDFGHVWVVTDQGETMSPGKRKAIEFTDEGMHFDWRALGDMPRTFAMGVSVFPLHRELLLVLGVWILLCGRGLRLRDAAVWLAVLACGLLLLREGGRPGAASSVKSWTGLGLWAGSLLGVFVQGRRAARRLRSGTGEPT